MKTHSCPKCEQPMEEGYILDLTHGNYKTTSTWIAGKPEQRRFWGGLKTDDRDNLEIQTFRCTACGFLESYASKTK